MRAVNKWILWFMSPFVSEYKIIIDAIDPGPAIKGIPSGVYATSFLSSASFCSDGVVLVLDLFDSTISRLILNKIIPPAILKACIVVP